MTIRLFFDDVLPRFAAMVKEKWGDDALCNNVFLRDADGRLTFVVLDSHGTEARAELSSEVEQVLGGYVDSEFAVATPDELFDDSLSDKNNARKIELNKDYFSASVLLVDRRLVGADWLLEPVSPERPPVRLVFASIKGGVGRSTALCVTAAHLASRGKRILTIDLDLEAPGIGNMLLPGDTLPEFGLLDYLVEQHIEPLDDDFFADLVAASWLGGGRGRVDVIPAIGKRSSENPENVLAKIARAYLVTGSIDGKISTGFASRIQELLKRIAVPTAYDVVLIDARAGLHETSAAAILGLGAEVLLFGIDQTQTITGYEMLFAHLATLPRRSEDDWRDRLNLIHAKANLETRARTDYAESILAVAKKHLWPTNSAIPAPDLNSLRDEFATEWQETSPPVEEVGPSAPIVILDSQRFQSFDPLRDRGILEERIYRDTFGEFLQQIDDIVENERY